MKTRDIDQGFYDLRWSSADNVTERERNRLAATLRAVPESCQSILDIGAGNGFLSNELVARGKSLVAVDISEVALARVKAPTLRCSADHLTGVDERSFDLVLCTEMLEHLDECTYEGALREFTRVARQAILVTVPNRELMLEHMGLCGNCGSSFHIWGHRRRFTPETLKNLFSDFELVSIQAFGDKLPKYSWPLLWMRTAVAGAWFVDESSPCPECHSFKAAEPKHPTLARFCDLLNSNLPKTYSSPWLMALYRRIGFLANPASSQGGVSENRDIRK